MKRFLALLLSLLFLLSLCGCGDNNGGFSFSYSGDFSSSAEPDGSSGGSDEKPPVSGEGDPFKVSLTLSDSGSMPELDGISAVWTSKLNVYASSFSADDTAVSYEPDGEYRVTLSATPKGYTYDPNIYYSDNKNKEVEITLYPIKEMTGDGAATDAQCYKLPSVGTYRFEFSRAEQQLYFVFTPRSSGVYQFRSLMDVTANEINTTIYTHGIQFINPVEITEVNTDQGQSNSYTKNFKSKIQVSSDELGASRYYSLRIHSNEKTVFPAVIDVQLTRIGDYERDDKWQEAEVPEIKDFTLPSGTFRLIADTNDRVLDRKMVGYTENKKFTGYIDSDGYYRVGSLTGPVLFAKLKGALPYIPDGLNAPLFTHKCSNVYLDYTKFYAAHSAKAVNGYVPVTQAVADYLYNLSVSKNLFWDGNGVAETIGYSSDEYSQWLFACGYFK